MSPITIVIVLLVAGVIVAMAIIALLTPSANQRRESNQKGIKLSLEPLVQPPVSSSLVSSASPISVSQETEEVGRDNDVADGEADDDPLDPARLKERIRTAEIEGKSTQEVLTSLIDDLDDESEIDDIVHALAELRYTPQDLAPPLMANRYAPATLAGLFHAQCDADVATIIAALLPVVPGETVRDRARQVLGAIQESESVDWNDGDAGDTDPVDCIEPLLDAGIPSEDVLALLCGGTDLTLGALIAAFPSAQRPDLKTVARVVRTQNRDIVDDEERDALREEAEYDAKDILRLCCLADVPMTDAADLVELYEDDELDEALTAFLGAGYGFMETMRALNVRDTLDTASLVDAALDADVPQEDIVAFLIAERVDPEELDNDLRENTEIPFRDRIALLHTLVEKSTPAPPPPEKSLEG